MNKNMIGGLVRHGLTIIAGAVLANSSGSLDTTIKELFKNIAAGDATSITSTIIIVLAILWSMWVKATEETKTKVFNTLTFKGGK